MRRLTIREGWSTFFLIALVVFTATWSVQKANWADGLSILGWVTLVGLLVGLIISLLDRLPSLLAHIIALGFGTFFVLFEMTNFLSDSLGGRRAKLDYLWMRWQHWFQAVSHGQRADDLYLFVLLMAAILWVVSYLSVWFIFRSHWIWLTLLLPGVILLLNMGYSTLVPHWLLVLYLFASIMLLMRFTFAERELSWRRIGIPFPKALHWRGFWVAGYLGLIVIIVGWAFPLTASSEAVLNGWNQVNGPWRSIERNFNSWFAALHGPQSVGVGGYAAFGDNFKLGGPLQLSQNPVVLIKDVNSAPYLIAHTYDDFTGTGWKSTLDNSGTDSAGGQQAQTIGFSAGQSIPVPQNASKDTKPEQMNVKIYQPRGGVIYTLGDTTSISVPSQVRLSWYQYKNQSLDLRVATKTSTPPILWDLVQQLQSTDFTPAPQPSATPAASATSSSSGSPSTVATPSPTATPGTANSVQSYLHQDEVNQVDKLQTDLRSQYGITVHYAVDPTTHKATNFTFTGSLPVYSDIEAILAANGISSGDTYSVSALVPNATPQLLRTAGTDYPQEITSRYLELPPQVSDRTRALTQQLASGKHNAFDIAEAIQNYLRTNLKYNEAVPAPPSGNHDLVDYFLFDSKQGYCTYYASAMAEMLRIEKIPARVAVGFYPADYDQNAQGYLYRDRNAHAWVEVYFPNYGWVPFEPTAARPVIEYGPAPAVTTSSNPQSVAPNPGRDSRLNQLLEQNQPGGSGGPIGPIKVQHTTTPFDWAMRGIVAFIILLGAVIAFLWLRGTRNLSPTGRFYSKLQRGTGWTGISTKPSMTPYEFASDVSNRLPGARAHARYLAELYVRERYGQQPVTAGELSRARSAWFRLRGMLLRYALVSRWRRPTSSESTGFDDD